MLFCWELGGGLGHLMQMRPLAEDLARAGHRVYVALRHLEGAAAVFGSAGVRFLQAPGRFAPAGARFPRPATFAYLLANLGFDDDLGLFAGACAWRNLIESVGPDLLVFDHAPTALLASRGMDCRRALIGSGFCCPPDGEAMAVLRAEEARKIGTEKLAAFEGNVVVCANRYLERRGGAPMNRLGQLYGDVDENFLTTFPELDHFPGRKNAAYWGPVIDRAGEPAGGEPHWPDAKGPRVFAYLKASRHLPAALAALGESGRATLVVAEGAGLRLRERFTSDTLALAPGPVDLARAAAECDVAVLNGGHGATAELLLAGKPLVQIPLALEQRMTADAVMRMGAGKSVRAGDTAGLGAALERVIGDRTYADAARRFADRYALFDPRHQRGAVRARALGMFGACIATRASRFSSRSP